jgi:hypothetical protein
MVLATDVAKVVGYGGRELAAFDELAAFEEVAGAASLKLDEPGTWTLREVRAAAEVEVAADGVTVMMTVSEVWPMMVVVW